MKLTTALGLSLFLCVPAAFAQDVSKSEADSKPSPAKDEKPETSSLADKRVQIRKAEAELREAQQTIQKAQRDVQKAQREAETAAREQTPTAGARDKGASMKRIIIKRATGDVLTLARPGAVQFLVTFGMELAEADAVLRSQLTLPPDQGLVVTRVIEKRLADQAGIKPNDVLVKINGQPVGKVAQVQQILTKIGKIAAEVEMISEGKSRKINLVGSELGVSDAFPTYWIGVPVAPVDATLRSHLANLPQGAGLIATDVVTESPASKAGVKRNDILIKYNNEVIKTQEKLIEQVQKSEGKESKLELIREGRTTTLTLTPERRAATGSNLLTAAIDLGPGSYTFQSQNAGEMSPLMPLFPQPINATSDRISGDMTKSLKGYLQALDTFKVSDRLDAELQQQLKVLSGQIEDLRKSIDEMKRTFFVKKNNAD